MSIYARTSFWSGLAERAISTLAGAVVSGIAVDHAIYSLDWKAIVGFAATTTLVSILKGIAVPAETDRAIATAPVEYAPRHAS
jgi:hypothetical protein|nr:MAG TPA: holin [Caudoviricetes sp.]